MLKCEIRRGHWPPIGLRHILSCISVFCRSCSCLRQVAQYQEKCVPIISLSFYCRRHFAVSAYSQCPNIPFIWTTKGSVKKYGRDRNGAARNTILSLYCTRDGVTEHHTFLQFKGVWFDETVTGLFQKCFTFVLQLPHQTKHI